MLQVIDQSDARRLTDVLRERSEHSRMFEHKGPVEERVATLQMVLEGGVLRQRFLEDGRRQTLAVYFRDDVINLAGYTGSERRKNTDYLLALKGSTIGSVTDAAVSRMRSTGQSDGDGISALFDRELGIAQERIVSLGQRSAVEAMSHFFCEVLVRCAMPMDNHGTGRCPLYMTQDMLATVLGISSVHVNRTLQVLRHDCLADIVDNELIIYDHDRLVDLAGFDGEYLAAI